MNSGAYLSEKTKPYWLFYHLLLFFILQYKIFFINNLTYQLLRRKKARTTCFRISWIYCNFAG